MREPNLKIEMLAKGKARLEIYDVLGPSWAGMIDTKLVAKQLKEAGELNEIEVRINSPGGSAFEGLGICNVLKAHPATINVVIDGIAASAASLVAMAGDTVRIPTNGMMMIHEPWTFALGTKDELQKVVAGLEAVTLAGIETYVAKCKQSPEKVAQWLKDETWFVGQEAVDVGLADTTDKELSEAKVAVAASVRQMFSQGPRDISSLFGISMIAKETPTVAETAPITAAEAPPAPTAGQIINAVPLTAADVKAAADKSVADERARIAAVMAVCQKAGQPGMANEFIANGTSLADVQTRMFEVLCAARPPVGDAGGNDAPAEKDPDAEFKKEYATDRVLLQKAGVSEADYIASRRVSVDHQGNVSMLAPLAKA